jgi:membrane protease YdiL (CAAX protease family)
MPRADRPPNRKRNIRLFIELGAVLGVYVGVTLGAFKSAMKVEWVWHAILFLFPIVATLIQRAPWGSLGLTLRGKSKSIELGIVVGALLTILLTPFYFYLSPALPESTSPLLMGYITCHVVFGVLALEFFYRGYMQPRFETAIHPVWGVVITSLLYGFNFWEYTVFDPFTVIFVGLALGFLFQRTKSLVSSITAHLTFLLLILAIFTWI